MPKSDTVALRKEQFESSVQMDSEDHHEEIRFLIVGKSGSGTSSTGNTILGEKKFNTATTFPSVDCVLQRSQRNGMNIEVMVCPGLCDTRKPKKEVRTVIIQALGGMHPGPHAVLFTTSLGRFTEEDYKVFKRLKELLDENVTKYMIVVFTGGDVLEDEGKTFVDMLLEAPINLVDTLEQVNIKYIIFNNKAKNPRPQVKQLIEMVRTMKTQNNGIAYFCPQHALITEGIEKEIAKRLKEVEMRDLEQQNLILELEAKAKEAEEQILRLQEELAKKERDLESKIKAEKETHERKREELLRKLELESQKHKEKKGEVQRIKHHLEMERIKKKISDMSLQNQHEEEHQQFQKDKETLQRQMRQNEEIKQKKKEEEEKLEVQREQTYKRQLRRMRDEISRKENMGIFNLHLVH